MDVKELLKKFHQAIEREEQSLNYELRNLGEAFDESGEHGHNTGLAKQSVFLKFARN